jgi:hypothetical protein
MTSTTERLKTSATWLRGLHEHAVEWALAQGGEAPTARTDAYIHLLFAFGLARLGDRQSAQDLLHLGKIRLAKSAESHQCLLDAYTYRINQALGGKPHTGPLPIEQFDYLETIHPLERYVVDRLRKQSIVLEPDQRINPYRFWNRNISDLEKALLELTDLTDRNEIANRVDKLLREVPKEPWGNVQRARVLKAGLEAAPRVGEDFARKLLDQAIPAYDALPEAREIPFVLEQARFLETGLFVAGHFGRVESVHPLVTRFQRMLQGQQGAGVFQVLDELAASAFRGLRKLGMRDEIDQILRQMAVLVLKGREIEQIDFKKEEQGPAALRSLLQVASGWYFFGRDSQAEPILQVAWSVLLPNDLAVRDQTQLACAYARAVGQAPVEMAQKRLEEIFRQLRGIKDTLVTFSHYQLCSLDVIESIVFAAVEVCSRS